MNQSWFDIIFTQANTGVVITVGTLLITLAIVVPIMWLESKIKDK